jgi:hypothetical protein
MLAKPESLINYGREINEKSVMNSKETSVILI